MSYYICVAEAPQPIARAGKPKMDRQTSTYADIGEMTDWLFSSEEDSLPFTLVYWIDDDSYAHQVDVDKLTEECRQYIRGANDYREQVRSEYAAGRM